MKLFGYIATFTLSVIAAVVLSVVSVNALAEQDSDKNQSARVNQGTVCVASSDEQALDCPEGELFMARLALSEADVQNPLVRESRLLNTMALYCDTNYQIHQTQAGVLCVLTHERINVAAQEEAADASEE
ncbi:hypothetical protein HLB35_05535 [Halomonas sp. TBZ9]|uniref:Uncharacterized protein n=1 Tax=Vreelandella azerica TaxID=2732867 RepID=A0A7Y3TX44_9GAMM|nr:hypothetical protein [Halomonas azerica]NOG31360.1 hypothetical protein [Halomonas azerica]